MAERPDSSREDRAARLAAQLRANLRRRKEQARAITAPPATKDDDAPPSDG